MMYRALSMVCFALALTLLVGGATLNAGDKNAGGDKGNKGAVAGKTYEGKIVNFKNNKLTVESKGKRQEYDVPNTTKVNIDGKEGRTTDLRPGAQVRVTTDDQNRVTRIESSSKRKGNDNNKNRN